MSSPYKVSILIPVYNAEHYIDRCATSIFEQTYSNLEIIFVNDCSNDASIEMLKRTLTSYPQRESDVKIINHETNKGIATTRNTALDAAQGEFIMFVDSDDWIELDTVEKCVREQQRCHSDIVTTEYMAYETDKTYAVKENLSENTKVMLEYTMTGKIAGRLWGHLIRRNLIEEQQLRFIDGADLGEDVLMMTLLWYFADKHSIISEPLYHYDHRNALSCTNTFSYKRSIQSFVNLDAAREFFEEHDKQYLDYVTIQELDKIAAHMVECCQDDKNRTYYNAVLLNRLDTIDKRYWVFISRKYRIVLYLKHYWMVRLLVYLSRIIKQ